uniref:CDC42 effector protein 5 n=1 Tax=Varanus komodoensis TaxID=61221 RepID=A0A8D2LJS1_VARKO
MPILKQSPVAHSKKRPRLDRAMISAPLGDFRHTMHIGRGGDAFGDTSFLSNHGGSKANGGNGAVQSPATSTPDESLLSFQLDLGPSILEDVLGVMDKDWDSARGQEQDTEPKPLKPSCLSTSPSTSEWLILSQLACDSLFS